MRHAHEIENNIFRIAVEKMYNINIFLIYIVIDNLENFAATKVYICIGLRSIYLHFYARYADLQTNKNIINMPAKLGQHKFITERKKPFSLYHFIHDTLYSIPHKKIMTK